MSKKHSKCGDKIGYGRFKLRLPVLRLGFWPWAFHSRSGMTRAFIWHQKVKIANLQLSNVMLKDRELWSRSIDEISLGNSNLPCHQFSEKGCGPGARYKTKLEECLKKSLDNIPPLLWNVRHLSSANYETKKLWRTFELKHEPATL